MLNATQTNHYNMNISICPPRPLLTECTLPDFNFLIDPYKGCGHLCHYCYVLNQAETDWSQEIMRYEDIEAQLDEELADLTPQSIYMGWRTDPYQPCEAEEKQTRKVLEMLYKRGFSVSILTKSDLVLRDLDILQAMDGAAVSVSLAFDREPMRQLLEGNTRPTMARIAALEQCKQAGLRTSAMLCPVIPHMSDVLGLMHAVAPHVDKVWVYGLSILDESEANWRKVRELLRNEYPDRFETVQDAVFDKKHVFWSELKQQILAAHGSTAFDLSIHF